MKSDAIIVTLMFSSGKTVAFNTTSRYIPAIKLAIEESGKHDRHKLTSVFDFMPDKEAVGPDISVCIYDIVLMTSITMQEVKKMKQQVGGKIFVPTAVPKQQTIKLN